MVDQLDPERTGQIRFHSLHPPFHRLSAGPDPGPGPAAGVSAAGGATDSDAPAEGHQEEGVEEEILVSTDDGWEASPRVRHAEASPRAVPTTGGGTALPSGGAAAAAAGPPGGGWKGGELSGDILTDSPASSRLTQGLQAGPDPAPALGGKGCGTGGPGPQTGSATFASTMFESWQDQSEIAAVAAMLARPGRTWLLDALDQLYRAAKGRRFANRYHTVFYLPVGERETTRCYDWVEWNA